MTESLRLPVDDVSLVIFGGHYCINDELAHLSADGAAEQASFASSVDLFVRERSRRPSGRVRLILWVNDIGIDKARRDALKEDYQLPPSYMACLVARGVEPEAVAVEFESSIRNKASTWVRQIHKRNPHLFQIASSTTAGMDRCIDKEVCDLSETAVNCYTITGPNQRPLVLKEGPNPKCNLILASLYQKYTQGYPSSVVVNVFNAIYKNRIRLGAFVYKHVFEGLAEFRDVYTTADGRTVYDAA